MAGRYGFSHHRCCMQSTHLLASALDLWIHEECLLWLQNPYPPNLPETACVQLGFLPLNHLMGRMTLLKCLLTGGRVHQRPQSAE